MHSLPIILISLLAPTLAGVGVVIALVAGLTGLWPLLAAAGGGVLASIPLGLFLARVLKNL